MSVLWVWLVVGGVTFAVGSVLALVGFASLSKPRLTPRQSFLAPILVVDALDPDLRVVYSQSMVLDARWDVEHPGQPSPRLGAEIRRLIVEVQAVRRTGGAPAIAWGELLECEDDWSAAKRRVQAVRERLKNDERPVMPASVSRSPGPD
ncbi:MAG: hypothetical protein R3E66_02410 [bacterium]